MDVEKVLILNRGLKLDLLTIFFIVIAIIFSPKVGTSSNVFYLNNKQYVLGLKHHYDKFNIEYNKDTCHNRFACDNIDYYADLSLLVRNNKQQNVKNH